MIDDLEFHDLTYNRFSGVEKCHKEDGTNCNLDILAFFPWFSLFAMECSNFSYLSKLFIMGTIKIQKRVYVSLHTFYVKLSLAILNHRKIDILSILSTLELFFW